ncbi:structural maintenance of chromosomes flexible hinge domain-containing protein 1-like [Ptychodera flava]|uniref:structural maintenance of chromosomes flexible hinge domain-containing protein 1-like n=1 Tax=Ptychodera flava TaxID=63121 RepID=UPI00396A7965
MAAKLTSPMPTSSFIMDEEDTVVYIYDRRRGSAPEKKIQLGGIFDFNTFRTKVCEILNMGPRDKFVISTTNRMQINDDDTYEDLIEGGDTLYVLNHMNQELAAQAQERIEYLPHYDTLVKSGMYEYYASEGQNPLPFAFAELIDNSLAATAGNIGPRSIEIRLFLDESPAKNQICVIDNGCGMTSRQLNNWAIYRLSKFIRKEKKGQLQQIPSNLPTHDQEVPRSLNSDISYFGVGGKQAIFFIGHSTRMISKPCDSKDVHELTISKEEFERREKNREAIYSGYIRNRKPGDSSHVASEDEIVHSLIKEEIGKRSFTAVIITGISPQHIQYLRNDFKGWCRHMVHIYHYYIHGPRGNEEKMVGGYRPGSPFKNLDIEIVLYDKGKTPKQVNLRDINDDMQTRYIRSSADCFEFKAVVEGTGIVEGIIRYHPFLYDRETFPSDYNGPKIDVDFEYEDIYMEDKPARGNRPIFECYWNGRLIPYTFVYDFDWCAVPKKRGPVPIECYNRLSGVLWTNDKFQVSTNKLTFLDLEMKLKDKNTVFYRIVQGQQQRVKIERAFTEWLKECHETQDKQVMFMKYQGSVSRPEIPVKRHQSPWAVYNAIEWDAKVFEKGQLVRSIRTNPIIYGTIKRFLLFGHHEGDVFATGGEMEIIQEPQLLYDEVKVVPLTKLDRVAPKSALKRYIEEEEGRLPEKLVLSWPEGDAITPGEKRPAGKTVGAIQVEIQNRKRESISRLPGSIHSSKKLLMELKIIWHAPHGNEEIVSHISQHGKTWGYWFRKMENVKNLGYHTLKLQVVLNESGAKEFGGKELPSLKMKFLVTEAAPAKFSFGMMDPPFRMGEPFDIPLEIHDEFGHPTKPSGDLKPVLEASGLDIEYSGLQSKGTSLIVKGVTAHGVVGSHQGTSFHLKVTLPGIEEPTQTLKIRLQPGPPCSLHIIKPEDDDEIDIENGGPLSLEVEVRDKAGNITTYPRLNVVCKLSGMPGLPTLSADCSHTGKAVLTCASVNIKNFKQDLKLNARVELQHYKDIPHQERSVRVTPSTRVAGMEVSYTDADGEEHKIKNHQDLICTVENNSYRLYDEGSRLLDITPDLANKVRVNWTPKFYKELLIKGQLPNIKIPSSVTETKYCQVSISSGFGVEFSFTLKPNPGEPTQLKCTCKGSNKIQLGQKMDGDVVISITDSHGNPVRKQLPPKQTLAELQVFGTGLVISEMIKAPYQTHGFILQNIKFAGVGLGNTELMVKWRDLSDYVKLQLVAGPPAKMAVVDIPIDQPLLVYNDCKLEKPLILQLCDEADNPTTDPNAKVLLGKDPRLKLTPSPSQMKADSLGRVNFGRFQVNAEKGQYELRPKALIGRVGIQGPVITIKVQPDPGKAVSVCVTYDRNAEFIAGQMLPDFSVNVLAEDNSTITTADSKNIRMKIWQPGRLGDTTGRPPDKCLSFAPDARKANDAKGFFYFRSKKVPELAGAHQLIFQYTDSRTSLSSSTVVLNVHAGLPTKLLPVGIPGTPTVSNTQKSASRVLIRSLKLQLKDDYGNDAGEKVNGKVQVSIESSSDKYELPKLVGNVSSIEVILTKGAAILANLMIQENSPGRDGQEYIVRCQVVGAGLRDIEPYDQPFLFYNDAKKQYQMGQLTKQRDELFQTIRTYNGFFETTQQLIKEMKISVHEAQTAEQQLRSELRRQNIPATQLGNVASVDSLISQRMKEREELLNRPRRRCGLTAAPRDRNILGKIAHLSQIGDDDIARVLSWHMASDMDCVVTRTNSKAIEVYRASNGRQQVLPLDSIYRKNLPDWNKPLPHLKGNRSHFKPSGNPVFARNLLEFPADADECKIVFGMLLGDTIILDTLQDANEYRQEVVKITHCPTLLTREGDRIRSNGKFGGMQNKALPLDKLKGAVFGAPLPIAYHAVCTQLETLQNYRQAMVKRLAADKELQEQLLNENTPEMKDKRKEYQEAEDHLRIIERKLGMTPTSNLSPGASPRGRIGSRALRQEPPPPFNADDDEPSNKRSRMSTRIATPPGTPLTNHNGPNSGSSTPTRLTRRSVPSPSPPVLSKRTRRT